MSKGQVGGIEPESVAVADAKQPNRKRRRQISRKLADTVRTKYLKIWLLITLLSVPVGADVPKWSGPPIPSMWNPDLNKCGNKCGNLTGTPPTLMTSLKAPITWLATNEDQAGVTSVKVSSTLNEYPLPPFVLHRGHRSHQEESDLEDLNFPANRGGSEFNIEGASCQNHAHIYRHRDSCRSTCQLEVCYEAFNNVLKRSPLKMAQWNVVGHIRTFQIAIAASKVDPDDQTIYQLPMEDAQNGSENFIWRSPQDGGLGLPSQTRNGVIRKPPQDHTERAFENGWHKKSRGIDWKITYLFPEKLRATIEPLVEAAKKENRAITVNCEGKPETTWRYSLLTKETRFRKKTKYTLIRPDFNILNIPDLLSEGGSKIIS